MNDQHTLIELYIYIYRTIITKIEAKRCARKIAIMII